MDDSVLRLDARDEHVWGGGVAGLLRLVADEEAEAASLQPVCAGDGGGRMAQPSRC